jgi:hypothetical protein
MRIEAQPDGEVDRRFVPGTDSPEILETMTSPVQLGRCPPFIGLKRWRIRVERRPPKQTPTSQPVRSSRL